MQMSTSPPSAANTAITGLVKSTSGASGRVIPTTMSHRIPHRFAPFTQISPHSCDVCKRIVWGIKRSAFKCTECSFVCHEKCQSLASSSCGLSMEMLSSAMECTELARNSTPVVDLLLSAKTSADSFAAPVIGHDFQQRQFPSPVPCSLCDKPIWGISVQGMHCEACSCNLHKQCHARVLEGQTPLSACPRGASDREMESALKRAAFEHEESARVSASSTEAGSPGQTSLERRRSKSFRTDTLLRLTRKKYGHVPSAAEVFQPISPSIERKPASRRRSVTADPSTTPSIGANYQRREHQFRGHEFLATYLDLPNSGKPIHCKLCNKPLGDGGRQCYQCKSCEFVCHKKCYTLTPPCPVSIGSFAQDEKDQTQTRKIQYRNSVRMTSGMTLDRKDFVEDFTDELIKEGDASRDQLEDYVFEDKILGSGQYGVVKIGHYKHNATQRFAVKIIDKKRFWDPSQQKLGKPSEVPKDTMPTILKRELDILKKLDHPGIIRMHHFVDSPSQTLLIMDLAPDGDFLDYIMKRTRICEDLTRSVGIQVLHALKYLHDNGIVHRDLKPENLLLTNRNGDLYVQIADFGFATVMERVGGIQASSPQFMQSIVGTPAYMAPEIVDSRVWSFVSKGNLNEPTAQINPGYTKTADMWSLGVILYVALGGVFPFDSQKPILDQILRGEFFFPDEYFKDVGDDAVDFICRLLCVDPRKRIDCDAALIHPWTKRS